MSSNKIRWQCKNYHENVLASLKFKDYFPLQISLYFVSVKWKRKEICFFQKILFEMVTQWTPLFQYTTKNKSKMLNDGTMAKIKCLGRLE